MDIAQLKQYIIRKIEETDDVELLRKIAAIIDAHNNTPLTVNEGHANYGNNIVDEAIVAYTIGGKPLTETAYKNDIQNIVDDVITETIPHNQVKSTMDKWVEDRLNGIL